MGRFSDATSNRALLELFRDDLVLRLRNLFVDGVEVTQAIQYYHAEDHLTDPADRGADNSVRLIAGKPAWVRVYARSFYVGDVTGVTGTIEVQRRVHGFLWSTIATLSPQPPGSITARSTIGYAEERGTLTNSLNFIIPADQMIGYMRLIVRLQTPSGQTAEHTEFLDVTLQQTLRLAGILVAYNGPNGAMPPVNVSIAAPTVANLQTTAAWTLLTFPVRSAGVYRSAGTITWNLPLNDAPSCSGCCTPNWVALNAAVANQRTADGNDPDFIYYGLLPGGVPAGPIIGCESGVSSGFSGDQVTMAHEIGHYCGRPHSPCGVGGDAAYPAYEPYDPAATPQASIGEYGLDISNGNVFSPLTFKDFMSYCGPRWISLYVHGQLTNNSRLDPVTVGVDHPWWKDIVWREPFIIPELWLPDPPPEFDPLPWRVSKAPMQRVISVIGTVLETGELRVNHVARLDTATVLAGAKKTDFTAELVGENGEVISSAKVQRLRGLAHGCGCSPECDEESGPYTFQAFIPEKERGSAIRLRQGEKELWTSKRRGELPEKPKLDAQVRGENVLEVRWESRGERDELQEAWIRWSNDDGKTWHAFSTGLRGDRAELALDVIPAGRVLLQLMLHDGFETTVSEPVAVEVPNRPAHVSILRPLEHGTLLEGSPMRLWGAATSSSGAPVNPERCTWLIDGERVGVGLDVFVTAPKQGRHECTLLVDDEGGEAKVSQGFLTVAPGRGDQETYRGEK